MLTDENTENSVTDQSSIFKTELFIKFFTEFFNKDNEIFFDSSNSMSESVKNKAKTKKNTMKILSSQKEMSIMRYKRSKKKQCL